jgi:hypothetical protein
MAARLSLVLRSCVAIALAFFLAGAARADSNGVVPLDGVWSGTVSGHYWNQSSDGSVKPKQKFKSKVDVTIDQDNDEITMTINFDENFPVNTAGGMAQLVLEGFGGNYHVGLKTGVSPFVSLSGDSNKKGTRLSLEGVVVSDEFTHELKIKLKKQN